MTRLLCLVLGLAVLACEAQMQVTPNPSGAIDQISWKGSVLLQPLQMRIVKTGWSGTFAQQIPGDGFTREGPAGADALNFTGTIDCEGKPCRLEQTAEYGPAGEDWLRLNYKLTPSADLDTERVFLCAGLPTEGNAGAGQFITASGPQVSRIPLPATLPNQYRLAGADQMDWCAWVLPGDVGLLLEPVGAGISSVSFQDDRQFKMECFEAQLSVQNTRGLKANQTYEFGLTLRPVTAAQLEAKVKAAVTSQMVAMESNKPLALRGVRPSAQQVARYERLDLDLDLDATFDNPFDPEDIDVTATFVGPDGKEVTVPGFYSQDYALRTVDTRSDLVPQGNPGWQVRFAPSQTGRWTVTVEARDRTGRVRSQPVSFDCLAGNAAGFVRRVPDNPRYLQFDNGEPYFAVGENVCWGALDKYAEWFKALGDAGGNYCRIWLVRWNMALEWTNEGSRTGIYYGLGKYSLDNAWRLDRVMEMARQNGIRCMLCLGYHGELMETPDYFNTNCWQQNPYNKALGGPCEKPADFWTNPQARKLYQQKLRYFVARYGWDSHVLSWEFWNEVRAPAPWIQEMARWFRANDPYRHLITTTYGYDEVWQLPEIDYTQAHTYGSDENRPSTAPVIAALGREYTTKWTKPFMVGEFGIDWKTGDGSHDPTRQGTSLHNGMWASVMTRSFGTAALWYWDGYVHPFNLYHEFTSLRRFVDTVPWTKLNFELADFGPVRRPVAVDAPWDDIRCVSTLGWAKATGTDFTIRRDGAVLGEGTFSGTLFSPSKKDMMTPLRFRVTYPQDGKFILHIGTVSQGAVLHVKVDGQEVLVKDLPAGEGTGPWKKTTWVEQHKIWQSEYDTDIEVPVPAGEHVIELENSGKDWIGVTQYVFAGCRDPQYGTLQCLGMRTADYALLWLHDPESTWYNDKLGKVPQPIDGATTTLLGLADGNYQVEWWDTRKGEVSATNPAVSAEGKLSLTVPTFTRDVAAKVTRAR
ncbi:MAG: DUF5060 domain-containing protein [Armatimonadia bacterium]